MAFDLFVQSAARLSLQGVTKRYGDRPVLDKVDFAVEPGQFVALVGRSGCGKSTLLRSIAGLEFLDAGEIHIERGDQAARKAPAVRLMFQDARLLPWKRVVENVALGAHWPEANRDAISLLARVGLEDRARDWPNVLSGGQKQRVALARALLRAPSLLLLDEPLGALDALTRLEMQALVESLWLEHEFTALLVTHDVAEAVSLADRILLIDQGRVALDLAVDLPRPRRIDARFAAIEQQVLDRLLYRTVTRCA